MSRTLRIASIITILAIAVAWGLTKAYNASLETAVDTRGSQ